MLDKAKQLLDTLVSYRAVRVALLGSIAINVVRIFRDFWFLFKNKFTGLSAKPNDKAKFTKYALGEGTRALLLANTAHSLYSGKAITVEKVAAVLTLGYEAMAASIHMASDNEQKREVETRQLQTAHAATATDKDKPRQS